MLSDVLVQGKQDQNSTKILLILVLKTLHLVRIHFIVKIIINPSLIIDYNMSQTFENFQRFINSLSVQPRKFISQLEIKHML